MPRGPRGGLGLEHHLAMGPGEPMLENDRIGHRIDDLEIDLQGDLAVLARDELAQYIAEHSGRCRLAGCRCLEDKWRGCACPNWEPASAVNWEELRELTRREYGDSLRRA